MKTVIFWIGVILWVPFLISQTIQIVFCALLELVVGQRWKRIPDSAIEFFNGAVAAFLMNWFATMMEISDTRLTLLAMIAMFGIGLIVRKETRLIFPGVMGLIVGQISALKIFAAH